MNKRVIPKKNIYQYLIFLYHDSLQWMLFVYENDSGKFEARWVHLQISGNCVWTRGMEETLYFPVAHAEGKFVPINEVLLKSLNDQGQVIFRYCDPDGKISSVYPQNPNGAVDDIAGIADPTGRILGLMPHPERYFLSLQHPFWTRLVSREKYGQGARIFENGVEYVKKNGKKTPWKRSSK